MSHKASSTEMRTELRVLNKLIPGTAAGFATLSKAVKDGNGSGGPLSLKEKEYVALAIAVSQHCTPCIDFHVEALMKTGATREELGDVLAMCIQMGGGPALMYAANALACWDELATPLA